MTEVAAVKNGKTLGVAIPPKAEKKAMRASPREILDKAQKMSQKKLSEENYVLLSEIHADRVTKAELQTQLDEIRGEVANGTIASVDGWDQAMDVIDTHDREKTKHLARRFRKAGRLDANPLNSVLYWLEEMTRNWLPASAKAAGYGFIAYRAGKLTWRGLKSLLKAIRGDYVGSVQDAGEAFEELQE